jgi:hypothetical protein
MDNDIRKLERAVELDPSDDEAAERLARARGRVEGFERVERPFVATDGQPGYSLCASCHALLRDGRQIVSVPVEFPDDTFCDLDCAREGPQRFAREDDSEVETAQRALDAANMDGRELCECGYGVEATSDPVDRAKLERARELDEIIVVVRCQGCENDGFAWVECANGLVQVGMRLLDEEDESQ